MKIRPALDEVKTIAAAGAYKVLPVSGETVSYTHLTLPTTMV